MIEARAGLWLALLAGMTAGIVACGDDGDASGGGGEGDAAGVAVDAAAADAAAGEGEVDAGEGPACAYGGSYLVAGPCEPDYDEALDAKARRIDRSWRTFNAWAQGLNTDVSVDVANTGDRELIRQYVQEHDGWDFEAFSGKSAEDVITVHHKVAGLYAGVGIAADAFRYGVLRDQGYDQAEIDRAREHLLIGLEGLHRAATLPGKPGIIARGTARVGPPGAGDVETSPLFDEAGEWVPLEKNNGTWRDDQSGQYPGWKFEDSISRDQMLGWVTAAAAAWEVMEGDPSFDDAVRDQLRQHALEIGGELMVVRPNGYDLEIWDAEGRRTLHGCLHEHNLDCKLYSDGFSNGFHAVMALGAAAAWVYVSGDEAMEAWLDEELIETRRLHEIVRDHVNELVWAGKMSNYSNYNMAFGSMWLALRYLKHPEAIAAMQQGLHAGMYAIEGEPNQPVVLKQSLFDFIYAAGMAGAVAGGLAASSPDMAAVGRGLETLGEYAEAPYWDDGVDNCPEAVCDCDDTSVDSSVCVSAVDGTTAMTVLGCVGRNCDLIVEDVVPMALRPPSNYFWRSNPLRPNGSGVGANLLPAVDFRIAYWLGRFVRVTE